MKFDNFTYKAQEAIEGAINIARDYTHQQVEEAHLLMALLEDKEGVVKAMFGKMGVSIEGVAGETKTLLSNMPKVQSDDMQVYMSGQLQTLLRVASKEASSLKDEYVSSEHIAIALCGSANREISALFKKYGISKPAILSVLKDIRGSHRVTDQNAEEKYRALEKYTRDITKLAQDEKLDPVIGRDKAQEKPRLLKAWLGE